MPYNIFFSVFLLFSLLLLLLGATHHLLQFEWKENLMSGCPENLWKKKNNKKKGNVSMNEKKKKMLEKQFSWMGKSVKSLINTHVGSTQLSNTKIFIFYKLIIIYVIDLFYVLYFFLNCNFWFIFIIFILFFFCGCSCDEFFIRSHLVFIFRFFSLPRLNRF